MPTNVPLPALGESVTEGTISRWLKQVGDTVEADEALVEVSTDKVDTEIPSPVSGTVLEILVQEDETAEVGATLAVIGDEGESTDSAPAQQEEPQDAAEEQAAPEDPSVEEKQEQDAAAQQSSGGAAEGTEVTLPALGESVSEGTISRWLKAVGDTVEADEALVEVSTDKVDTEIPSPAAGTLLEIRVNEDETAEVGAVLAIIGDPNAAPGKQEAPKQDAPAPQKSDEEEPPLAEEGKPSTEAETEEEAPEPASGTENSGGQAGPAEGTEVTLPALGESVSEGTISRWLKAVGDTVEADEALVEVSTDKVDTEIPSPAAGTLLEIRVNEDETAEVGAVLAIIGDPNAAPGKQEAPKQEAPKEEPKQEAPTEEPKQEQPKEESKPEPKQEAPKAESSTAAPAPAVAPRKAAENADAGYMTPLVRKLAAQHGVDLSTVKGTGVGGRIRKQDVLAAAEAAKQPAAQQAPAAPAASAPAAQAAPKAQVEDSPKRGTTEKASRLRMVIAQRMSDSLHTTAQLTTTVEVDVTAISRLRKIAKDDFKAREGVSLSYLPFIAKAACEALKTFPIVNATFDQEAGTITYPANENLGIAVDTERGLLVPVIKDAGDLNVTGLAKKIADLASRTRASKVTPDELSGGTFTITNYGSAGALWDTPIINKPESAIMGTGALVKRPAVITGPDGEDVIAIRDLMLLNLTYDHRLIDGARAAQFLSFIKARLEEGDFGAEFGL